MKAKSNLFFVSLLSLLALCVPLLGFSGSGSGTEEDPYIITNISELQEMQDDLDAWYVLGNDIDASDTQIWNGGTGFEPVDTFTGRFDGRRHVITELHINRPSEYFVGLFGCIEGAEIKNVGLVDAEVTGLGHAGTLVGGSWSSIISCAWASGNVTGTDSIQTPIGGLIGFNMGTGGLVSRCYSFVNVDAVSSGTPANRAGGLAGENSRGPIIIDCYATGNVSGKRKIGGLVGDNTWVSMGGYIKRCYSTGRVTGTGGGLIGYNYQGGVTYDSYWDIQTSGKTSSCGGTGKTTAEMMQEATFVNWDFVEVWDIVENETYPFLRPVLEPMTVDIDIKPGSCPNPLNVRNRGVLPVAILGSEDFDVSTIDAASIFLEGVPAIRSNYEDVAAPVAGANDCECTTAGPDGYSDLTLKFRTQEIVEQLIDGPGEPVDGQTLLLTLTGALYDGKPIEGADCVVLVGNVPKWLAAKGSDINGDGIVNILDFAELATYWLESSEIE